MLKEQTNWRDHWPGNADNDDRPAPVFTPMKGYTWLYVTIPLVFYLFDWSWRKVSRRQPVNVSRVVVHGPDVIELVVDRWMSHSQPGQVSSYFHLFNKKNKNSLRDNQHPFFSFCFSINAVRLPSMSNHFWFPMASILSLFGIIFKVISYLIRNSKPNMFRILVLRFNSSRMDSSHEN
jgi:hypothetical protein